MRILRRWLDIRPGELRPVALSFFGAFCVVSFLILGRSLREAFYLTVFDVTTLPYVTAAVAVLGLPVVAGFSACLARYRPGRVLQGVSTALGVGLLVLWPLVTIDRWAVVTFYLWTALGTLVLTSGFWLVTSEHFEVRGAKRLYGLIGGGGTLGAVVTGTGLGWVVRRVDPATLVPVLVALVAGVAAVQVLLGRPTGGGTKEDAGAEGPVSRGGLTAVLRSPHFRSVALIVGLATAASTLLDYQFKELVRANLESTEALAGYFGAFYGWTGFASLILQFFVASRLMTAGGIGRTLAVLPLLLLLGGSVLAVAPSLVLVTLVRGGDASVRKSLHRSVLEVLYVPTRPTERRRVKPFIDSVVDSSAEGLGAAVVFVWVTWGGLPTRYLSVFVVFLAAALLFVGRRTARHYLATLLERLREGDEAMDSGAVLAFDGKNLLTATLTGAELEGVRRRLRESGAGATVGPQGPSARTASAWQRHAGRETAGRDDDVAERLSSADPEVVERALRERDEWTEAHVPVLCRLLARDVLYRRSAEELVAAGDPCVPYLASVLEDDEADFVLRRRIPYVLARVGAERAERALLTALEANRFEIRYRAAIALAKRQQSGGLEVEEGWEERVWAAIRREVGRERPVWELQTLLDGAEAGDDGFVARRVDQRGELSLEHTFRLLSLVLDRHAVRTAYHAIVVSDERYADLALEYLEHVLPEDVRRRLWPFIGDFGPGRRERDLRPMEEVVDDLLRSGATLFLGEEERDALRAATGAEEPGRAEGGGEQPEGE